MSIEELREIQEKEGEARAGKRCGSPHETAKPADTEGYRAVARAGIFPAGP